MIVHYFNCLPPFFCLKIWDLSDPEGNGYLSRTGLFTAIKLISVVQAGREPNSEGVKMRLPPPRMVRCFSCSLWKILYLTYFSYSLWKIWDVFPVLCGRFEMFILFFVEDYRFDIFFLFFVEDYRFIFPVLGTSGS